ncbi:hypothetical protein RclHR1_10880001 [Rhizophagus clarus]|uniref:Reverse transcriptase domain-containing protein n=1 Tax=Rhizophagus clarus TaxID=94130 RepID=A0A2Z6QVM1_9GLOM|nr:hypothetical protein RclHR1_10880001 [Rhizophagus clarus]
MNSAKINIKQKKKKIKQNRHPLYDSDLKRDLNMLKGMLNKIRKEKLDFNDRSIENRKKIIAHITALHIRRLSQILKNNNVLKGNQFAALPGNSTFEPICMINEIIQDAKENNKELWLHSQDLGKAYDHVNIFMLEKNQVITAYGLTDPYDVLIGIYQGEVISPLLWCIYYDPLLCEIEQRKLGYTLKAPKIALNKFYGEDTSEKTEKLIISSSAYMDDT